MWTSSRYLLCCLPVLLLAGCAPAPVEPDARADVVAPVAAVEAPRISVPSSEEPPDEPLRWVPPEIAIGEGEAASALVLAGQALGAGRLYEDRDAAIPLYLALRQHPGAMEAANAGLLRAAHALLAEGRSALYAAADGAEALQQVQWDAAVFQAIWPVLDEIKAETLLAQVGDFLQQVERVSRVWALNDEGEHELWAGRLGENGGGALARFRAAEELIPGLERTRSGLAMVETALIWRAEQAARHDDFAAAGAWLAYAEQVLDSPAVPEAQTRIEHVRSTRMSRLRAQAVAGLGRYGGIQKAQAILRQMEAIAHPGDRVAADLRARIETAMAYGVFGPGQMLMDTLHDGGHGPQMVVIGAGAFQMGAVMGDMDAHANEQPAHQVRFERGFAISVHEITVGEFGRFIRASGYQPRAVRRGFSMAYDERSGNFVRRSGVDWQSDYVGNPAEPELPVVHVSAIDAAAYAAWLSAQTGAVYRLPSEAEFEYVLRTGNSGRYPWGDEEGPPPGAGNLTGSEDLSPGGRTWANAFAGYGDAYWGPAPAGQFAANAWNVHDLAGNVSEWVADCWHGSYLRAPGDGSAWVNPGCRDQVIRGGSWASSPAQTRASWRAPASVDTTNARIGFRVVRVL